MTTKEVLDMIASRLDVDVIIPNKTKIRSPFRSDNNPGCYFWVTPRGEVFFVDWSADKTHMHWREFLSRLGVSVNAVVDINNGGYPQPKNPPRKKITVEYDEDHDTMPIAVDYFNSYGIPFEYAMHKYNLRLVKKLYIIYDEDDIREVPVRKGEFAVEIYRTPGGSRRKVYFPMRKKPRFIANVKNIDIGKIRNDSDRLIITKSMKDAMVLDLYYGSMYDIWWVQSETIPISWSNYAYIKDNYREVRVAFDNDRAGNMYGQRLVRLMRSLKLPVSKMTVPDSDEYKDFADYIKVVCYGCRTEEAV